MKLTSFNPQIITKDREQILELFEALGFEKRHNPKGIGKLNVEGIRMKDANGFYLDISQPEAAPMPHDIVAIRMNVDNFDEAYDFLQKRGFRNLYGDDTVDTGSSQSAIMVSASGLVINLVHHVKLV